MPFTLAHPAAVLPLGRRLPRATVFSALIVGSMTPDFAYFIPFDVTRGASHGVAALATFCLPAGFAIYLAFHLLLKRPLVALLPARFARLLAAGVERALPPRSGAAVALSIVLGAATHILWDSFTHSNGQAVARLAFLRATLFHFRGAAVEPCHLLQQASTVAGLAIVGFAARRALREAVPGEVAVLPRPLAVLVAAALAIAPAAAGVATARSLLGPDASVFALRGYAFAIVVSTLRTFTVTLALYALAWHAWRALRPRAASPA